MNVEMAVRDRIASKVTRLSDRVWVLFREQHGTTPSVRVQLISEVKPPHLRGPAGTKFARVQTDVFVGLTDVDDAYTEADDVMNEIESALGPEPFDVGGSPADVRIMAAFPDGRRPMFEPGEDEEVRVEQDFLIWWKHL